MADSEPAEKKKTLWSAVKRPLRVVLIAYILVVMLLGFLQRRMLYHPSRDDRMSVALFPNVTNLFPAARDVRLTCSDGVSIGGWLLQQETDPADSETSRRPLVLYFHGNAGNRSGRVGWYELLQALDVDVLAIDYHGYGDSEGSMNEAAMESDCEAAWDFALQELGRSPSDIIVMGTSLGGAGAVYLTSAKCRSGESPCAMITVATFSSMTDAGKAHYPWLPVRTILMDRYPSDERIGDVTCPILHLHGDQDRVVSDRLGQKLFEAASEKSASGIAKRWVTLPGTGHSYLTYTSGNRIRDSIAALLKDLP